MNHNKRNREENALEIDALNASGDENIAPPAKSPNLGKTYEGLRATTMIGKANRFGFSSQIRPPSTNENKNLGGNDLEKKDIMKTVLVEEEVAKGKLEAIKAQLEKHVAVAGQRETASGAMKKAIEMKPIPVQNRTEDKKSSDIIKAQVDSVPKNTRIAKSTYAKRKTTIPKPKITVRSTRSATNVSSDAMKTVDIPSRLNEMKLTSKTSPKLNSNLPAGSFIDLLKQKLGIVDEIEALIKPRRPKAGKHDWKGKFEEQRSVVIELRSALKKCYDEV